MRDLAQSKTTWPRLLQFAGPSRQSILFPNLADAARVSLRTLPSPHWSAVGRFYDERERDHLGYRASDPREPFPTAIRPEVSRNRTPGGDCGESESAVCESANQSVRPSPNQRPQPLSHSLPALRAFPLRHRSLPSSLPVPLEFPIDGVLDKCRRRPPKIAVRRPHRGVRFASANLPATECASLPGRYFWIRRVM